MDDKKEYVLGVDGGATKTDVQIADLNGNKLAETRSGSSNYISVGVERAVENLNKAIFSTIKKIGNSKKVVFKSSCFGFAGNNSPSDLKNFKKIVFNNKLKPFLIPERTIICNDTRIGLDAGSSCKNRIILIAGTGSNCFGINENGEEAKANGWDYILADEGSGYQISIKALRAFMRAYDGRGKKTMLSETILEDLNISGAEELIKWTYGSLFSKDRFAAIAKTVCRTAKMGDKTSMKILEEEANEAVISVSAVADKLGIRDKEFDLVFVGNVFKCRKYFKDVLIGELEKRFGKINFCPLLNNPVEGAVKLAIENL